MINLRTERLSSENTIYPELLKYTEKNVFKIQINAKYSDHTNTCVTTEGLEVNVHHSDS